MWDVKPWFEQNILTQNMFSQSTFAVLLYAFAVSGRVQVVTIIEVSGSVVWVVTTLSSRTNTKRHR